MSLFIESKARLYIGIGAHAYASLDLFSFPYRSWGEGILTAIHQAMMQFSCGRGFSRNCPLSNITYEEFLFVIRTLHFDIVMESYSEGIDTIYLCHTINPDLEAVVCLKSEYIDTGLLPEDFLDAFVLPEVAVPNGYAGVLLSVISQPCPTPCLENTVYVLGQVLDGRLLRQAREGGVRMFDLIGAATRLSPQVPVGVCPDCGMCSYETCSTLLSDISCRVNLGGKADDEGGGILGVWLFAREEPEPMQLWRSPLA